ESSCDETAAAVVEDGRLIKSNIIASQIKTHAPFGGVVPELASREHLETIDAIVRGALEAAEVTIGQVDGIAVTQGPGLVGSLLVGISFAKSLAMAAAKPLVGVNHIEGHIYSVAFENPPVQYPALALVVSGGHTTLFLIPEEGKYGVLGRTRDDAAGEAFDKVAKLLGLGYPGGPVIDRLARNGKSSSAELVFTVPRMEGGNLDFSFSGLKTAVMRYVREQGIDPVSVGTAEGDSVGAPDRKILDLVASFQEKVVQSLLKRLQAAVHRHPPRTIILAGGVACNSALREQVSAIDFGVPVYFPSPVLTTDNAAMIAAAGCRRLVAGEDDGLGFSAIANMKLENVVLKGYEVPENTRYRV